MKALMKQRFGIQLFVQNLIKPQTPIAGLNETKSSGRNSTSRDGESPCGYSPNFSASSQAHVELELHRETEIKMQIIALLLHN